tara:strand:+ start:2718 stop:3026 length:309 start_codon:yes stop_codon:yes gene_type:complete
MYGEAIPACNLGQLFEMIAEYVGDEHIVRCLAEMQDTGYYKVCDNDVAKDEDWTVTFDGMAEKIDIIKSGKYNVPELLKMLLAAMYVNNKGHDHNDFKEGYE